jgi:hypothetical protein
VIKVIQELTQIRLQEYHEFFGSPILTEKENKYLMTEEVILLHNIRVKSLEYKL